MKRLLPLVTVLVGLVFAAGVSPPSAGAAALSFGTAAATAVGDGPRAVAIADFNRDGKLDLAVANGIAGTVSILIGTGSGGYGAPATVSVGTDPRAIARGDFDRDGDIDLAVANYGSTTLSILTTNGSGTFAAKATYSVSNGPEGITRGDFNRDGDVDLAVTNNNGQIAVLLGASGATFGTASYLTAGTDPADIVSGDFDRDGDIDLAAANVGSDNLSVLLGNGSGGFASAVSYAAGDAPTGLVSFDVDRDGKLDLVVGNDADGDVRVYAGSGSGTFTAGSDFVAGTDARAIAAGDLDRDGRGDLVVANHGSDTASTLLGTTYVATGWGFEPATSVQTGDAPTVVGIGDFNRDGKPDVVATAYDINFQSIALHLGNGSGGLGTPTFYAATNTPFHLVVADLNGDAKDDIAVTDLLSDEVLVYLGNGSGGVSAAVSYPVGPRPYAVDAGDLDRDGDTDLIVVEEDNSTVRVLVNNGSGVFSDGTVVGMGTVCSPRGVVLADLNRDGKLDVVTSNYNDDQIGIRLGNGTGGFGALGTAACGSFPWAIRAGDFNRDGIVDIATANTGSYCDVSVLTGVGNGTFNTAVDIGVGLGGATINSLLIDDLNRDGSEDIGTGDFGEETLTMLRGQGNGGFSKWTPPFPTGTNGNPWWVTYTDLNRDGRNDIVTAGYDQGYIGVVLGDSTPPTTTNNAPAGWRNTAVTVTLGRTDTGSGVASTSYRLDGLPVGWSTGTSIAVPAPADGSNNGVHTIEYFSTDLAGNIEDVKTCTVRIDVTAPTMSSVSSSTHPAQASWYSNNAPSFSWTGADAHSGVNGYSYVMDQSATTTPDSISEGTGTTYTSPARADGTWYLHVRAVDLAGNWGTAQHFTVNIDTVAPGAVAGLASSTHPVASSWYPNNTPAFSWSAATDASPSSGLAGYSYVLDQTAGTTPDTAAEGTGTSYTSGAKGDGVWYYHVRAVDNAGNGGSTSHYTVRIDTIAPVVSTLSSSTHPVQADWYTNATPSFSWTGFDEGSGIDTYSYVLDQTTDTTPDTVGEGSGTTYTSSSKADGIWYFHLRAHDIAGFWGPTTHFTVRIDTTGPTVTGLSSSTHPNQSTWYPNATPSFSWSGVDAGAGVSAYSYVLDQVADTTPDTTAEGAGTSYTSPAKADGLWYFHVRAQDAVGNWGGAQHFTVRIDTADPVMSTLTSATHPVTTTWYTSATPGFSWSGTDTGSGVDTYSYVIDQVSTTTPDTTGEGLVTTWTSGSLADGTWYFHVRAHDAAGNWGAAMHRQVRIDATAPAAISGLASSTHPVEANWYTANAPALSWNAGSDATSGVAGYSYLLNTSASTVPDAIVDTTSTSVNYGSQSSATWYFHVRAVDNAGNGGATSHYALRIDTVLPPAPTVNSSSHPTQATWYSNNDPALSWSCTDTHSGVAGYSYILDQTSTTVPDTTSEGSGTSTSYTDRAEGVWYFHVRAVDLAGNWGTTTHYTVRIDTVAPSSISGLASSTHASQSTWYSNNDPAFSWSAATDAAPGSGVAGYSYVLDQASGTTPDATSEGSGVSTSFLDKADGTWYFHVRSVDGAGNAGAVSHYTVLIDTTGPSVGSLASATHPVQSTWYVNNDPTLSWLGSDGGSGVSGYSYILDQTPATTPDTVSEGLGTSTGYVDKADGVWYFHVRAVDTAGNWGTAQHYTLRVDVDPAAVTSTSSASHPVEATWYQTGNAGVSWTGSDAGSGLTGYSYILDQTATTTPDTTSEGTGTSTSYSSLADGVWYFHVRAVDGLGQWGTAVHRALRVDTVAPDQAVVSSSTHPVESTWYLDANPTFEWSTSDATSGVTGYSYLLDAIPDTNPDTISEGAATSTSYAGLADGVWYLHVRARDAAGNWGPTGHRQVQIDAGAPVVTSLTSSTHPVPTSWYDGTAPAFDWVGEDDTSLVVGYSFALDQVAETVPDTISEGAGTTYTGSVAADGVWYFHVRACDSAGVWGAPVHLAVRVDTAAPTMMGITSSTHADPGLWYASATPAFSWSASDAGSGPVGYSYVIDQVSDTTPDTTSEGASASYTSPALADGTWYFHVRAVDEPGHWSAAQHFALNVDAGAPAAIAGLASSSHPVQATWYSNSAPAFSWSAGSDAFSGVAGYGCVLDQNASTVPAATVTHATPSASYSGKADGIWYFHVRTIDNAGNGGATSHYTVRIDTVTPSAISGLASSTHASQSAWYANSSPAFSWSAATDAAPSSTVTGYSYVLDQTSNTTPDTITEGAATSASFSGKADGIWYFHVRAVDGAGNGGAVSHYTARIDTVVPSAISGLASSTHPSQVTWYAISVATMNWGAGSDATSGVSGYSYLIDTSSTTAPDNVVEGASATYTSGTLASGTRYFHVRTIDLAGNAGPVSHYRLYIDTANPATPTVASATHASQTTWYSSNDPALSWSCTDTPSGVAGYSYVLDQVADTTPDTTSEGSGTTTSYTDKADGVWYFHVRAVDQAGNWGVAQHFTVRIDTGTPSLGSLASASHPVQATWYANNDPAFSWSGSDGGSGVAGYSYVLDQVADTTPDATSEGAGTTVSYTDKADGLWYFHVRTIDYAGNAGAAGHYAVRIDTAAPVFVSVLSASHPSQSTWYADNDPALSWACVDASSGIAGYSYVLDQVPATTPDTTSEGTGTTASFSDRADGVWYFHVRALDGAGTWSGAEHYTVRIDTAAPTVASLASATHPVQATWYASSDPAFGWSGSDASSGVAGYSYVLDQVADTTPDTTSEGAGATASFTGKADGIWYFHVRAVDTVGLWGTAQHYTVRIDAAMPSTTDNHDAASHRSFTLVLTPSDATSGVALTEYRVDGGAWSTGTSLSMAIKIRHKRAGYSRGAHLVEYRSTDNAGNVETIRSCTVTLN